MSDRIALALIALSGSQFTRDDFGGGVWVCIFFYRKRFAQLILVVVRNIVILFLYPPSILPLLYAVTFEDSGLRLSR